MAELVDENKDRKAYAKFEAVERPVDREERKKTEKEFQFEDGEKQAFAFCEQDGDWCERAQAFRPIAFRRLRGGVFFCHFEFVDFSANPFSLVRIVGKKREGFPPLVAGLWKGVLFLELICFRGDADQLFAIEERVALRAIERAERHGLAAVVAIANGFNDRRRGHRLRLAVRAPAWARGPGTDLRCRSWARPFVARQSGCRRTR